MITSDAKGLSAAFQRIIERDMWARLDFKLLNLQMAKCFADCYHLLGNERKAFSVLASAWDQNKKAVDEIVETYLKYSIFRNNLKSFFDTKDQKKKSQIEGSSIFEDEIPDIKSLLRSLEKLNSRIPIILCFYRKKIDHFMTIENIKQILFQLA